MTDLKRIKWLAEEIIRETEKEIPLPPTPLPTDKPKHIFGLHDPGGEHLILEAGKTGWVLVTEEIGDSPFSRTGQDYRFLSSMGLGVIVRANHGYNPWGTIPLPIFYDDFAVRFANFAENSLGCHTWIVGNEMNHPIERPQDDVTGEGALILPSDYARCYLKCRRELRARPGHESDKVIMGAVAPWNANTRYASNISGDWLVYFRQILQLIEGECDGIAIHTYTHGADPNLVTAQTFFKNRPFHAHHYDFLAYRDFMEAIPSSMRHLPVYITETDQDVEWKNENTGWVQAAYAEINWWNQQPGHQQICCLLLYRWARGYDRWGIEGNQGVIDDFRQAMKHEYTWTTGSVKPKPVAIEIEDVINELPKHHSLVYKTRSLAQITHLVIHHSAALATVSPQAVARYHVGADPSRNKDAWPGIGYHYYIGPGGTVWQTNGLKTISYHCGQGNSYTIGICLAGNFMEESPTSKQLEAGEQLVALLCDYLDILPQNILGHKELSSDTVCPGDTWPTWKNKLV